MKNETIIQDYYGALTLIKSRRNEELNVFIADDDTFYLKLISTQLSLNPSFNIYTFSTGEECIEYVSLKPDIIILDYHLDGQKPYAQKGDIIKAKLQNLCPDAEIFLISTDKKLQFLKDLEGNGPNEKVLLKSNKTIDALQWSIAEKTPAKKGFFKRFAALFGLAI